MNRWYAIHTLPNSEKKAEFNLIRQGFAVFCPQFKKTRRHARKIDTVLAPLFPGYLFTWLDIDEQPWRSINGTYGVAYLVGRGERPQPVPAGLVEAIAAHQAEGGAVELPKVVFRPGDKLMLEEGPFKGLVGEFERMKDQERVMVLLNLMGGKVPVEAHAEMVSKEI